MSCTKSRGFWFCLLFSFPPLFSAADTVILELPKSHLKFGNQFLSLSLAVLMTTCFLYWRDKAGESLNRRQILEGVPGKHSRRHKEGISLREAASWGFYCKFLIYKQMEVVTLSQTLIALALTSVSLLLTSTPLFRVHHPKPLTLAPQSSSSASFLSDSTHAYSQALADSPAAAGQLTESWSVIPGRVGWEADIRQQHSLLTLWPPGQAQG